MYPTISLLIYLYTHTYIQFTHIHAYGHAHIPAYSRTQELELQEGETEAEMQEMQAKMAAKQKEDKKYIQQLEKQLEQLRVSHTSSVAKSTQLQEEVLHMKTQVCICVYASCVCVRDCGI